MQIDKSVLTGLGVTSARADKYLPSLNTALPNHNIDTPLRVAHFLAQVLHESGLMRFSREIWGPTAAQRRYEGRLDLGNTEVGDGFRFRGRGLIQLTGRSNYIRFRTWLNNADDVVADPDLVADKYAVHSAVFYWSTTVREGKSLNDLVDLDDVRRVTRAINGGLNGLADRMNLLDKAKALLVVEAPELDAVTHHVVASSLNMRSQPRVSSTNKVATLPQSTPVKVIPGSATMNGNLEWVQVQVALSGRIAEGFVASKFLRAIVIMTAASLDPVPVSLPALLLETEEAIPLVHLSEGNSTVTRARDGGRAHALGESGQPRRNASLAETKARHLLDIIKHLDSEEPSHLRYQPQGQTTFCNIYAYDYCYLARVYLPRVWWTDKALRQIRNGEQPVASFGNTVRELNANRLHDWFDDHGASYGWKRAFDLDVLQAAANNGEVCIIVAQRADLNRSGHIVAVIPEHDDIKATRNADGEVQHPVESQAGATNHRVVVKPGRWWQDAKFRAFSFWHHT